MLADDRKTVGLDELDSPARHSWEQALDEARQQGLTDKDRALSLAADVDAKPRAFNDTETAGLVQAAAALKNRHAELLRTMESESSPDTIRERAVELDRVESEFDLLTTALRKSGTEKGRALASQKLTLDQDYNLVSLVTRAKAKKGKSLTTAERAAFEKLSSDLEAMTKRAEAAEAKVREQQAETAVVRQPGRRRAMKLAERQAEYSDLLTKFRQLVKEGCD